MSLCDTCAVPGRCCLKVYLTGGQDGDRISQPMSFERAEHMALRHRLPFRPAHQIEDGSWVWWCTNLGRDGRCTDYENRPQLCRDYKPGSDELCVHHEPSEDAA